MATKTRTKPIDLNLTPVDGEVTASDAEWGAAVERARAAMLATFEGRMIVADAYEVAADLSEGRPLATQESGHTRADFARETDIPLNTLDEYRAVWKWLLKNVGYIPDIASYSHAVLAMKRGSQEWATVVEYVEFEKTTEPPTGYERMKSGRWPYDALRTHLKVATTRPPPGAKRTTPRDFKAADKLAKEFVAALAGADSDIRDYAFTAVEQGLYGPSRAGRRAAGEIAPDKHPKTKAGAVARRCEGLVLKALSTDSEPEALTFMQKAMHLIAEHNLAYEVKIGVRR